MFVLSPRPGSHLAVIAVSSLVILAVSPHHCPCRCCCCRSPRGILAAIIASDFATVPGRSPVTVLAGILAAIIACDFATVPRPSPVTVLAGILAAIIACDFATIPCRSPVTVFAGIWQLPLQ